MKSSSNHKTIFLLRHSDAKTKGVPSDFERELSLIGRKRVQDLAKRVSDNITLDKIYYSSAKRTTETFRILRFNRFPSINSDKLYLAEKNELIDFIMDLPDSLQKVLIIGHNNGLSELASYITSESIYLSTCEFIEIGLEIESWKYISSGIGILKRNIFPE
jgi:phosphohistidine phosphatase